MRTSAESTDTPLSTSRRLDSWKEIAAFFGKDVRTVRRWEADRDLPVHRLPGRSNGTNRASVHAYTAELEAWLRESGVGTLTSDSEPSGAEAASDSEEVSPLQPDPPAQDLSAIPAQSRWPLVVTVALICLALLVAGLWMRHRTLSSRAIAQKALASSAAAVDPQAQDLYLRGRYLWNLRTEDSLTRAVDLFTQAIVHDPQYAPAYAGLADSYLLLRQYGHMTETDAFQRAYTASRRAIALDGSSAEAHRSYAFVLNWWFWNAPEAQLEFRKAISLDPNDAQSHQWYATMLFSIGSYQDAVHEIDTARRLRPDSVAILANRGLLLGPLDREASLKALLEVEEANPGVPYIHLLLARAYLRLHRYPESLQESRQKAVLLHDAHELAVLDRAQRELKLHGERAMFMALADGDAAVAAQDHAQIAIDTAVYYASAGDAPQALHFLALSGQKRESDFHGLPTFPEFAFLKGNPSFETLLTRSQTPISPPSP